MDQLKKRRPGGRSQKVQSAVFASTIEILLREGYGGFRIADVADRAGVNETSIYRRWGSKEVLLLEALLQRAELELPFPDTGNLRSDLIAFLQEVMTMAQTPLGIALIEIGILSTSRPALIPYRIVYWQRRVSALNVVFARARERNELQFNQDTALLLELLTGPILSRLLVSGQPLNMEFASAVVDSVLSNDLILNAGARR